MKHLFLCRHAKSSWKDMTLPDIDRPLNKRGKKNAPMMGKRLHARGIVPDMIISSPARRALKTARKLAEKTGYSRKNIAVSGVLYGASPEVLLKLIQELDNTWKTVFLVGHNPETTLLANMLAGLDIYNVPTSGIVALEFDVPTWNEVDIKLGTLLFFDYPRKADEPDQA